MNMESLENKPKKSALSPKIPDLEDRYQHAIICFHEVAESVEEGSMMGFLLTGLIL